MTSRAVLPFPVLPGKDAQEIADRFRAEPEAYREDRANSGVTLERAYLFKTPMGDFVVAYTESRKGFMETMGAVANPQTDIGRWFVEKVKEIHGVDMTQPPAQLPEMLGEWVDPDVSETRQGFAFCAPLLADQVDNAREWAKRTYPSDGMLRTRRQRGDNKDVAMITFTEQGPVVAVYLEGRDPVASDREFIESQDPFDLDFKDNLRRLFPPFVDLSEVPQVTEIFDSEKLDGADLTGRSRDAAEASASA